MGEIETMSRGNLSEEYRERHVNGKTVQRGPYYKYQVWEDGRNKSRRVKADEAQQLRQGIEGLDKFKELSGEYIDATIIIVQHSAVDAPLWMRHWAWRIVIRLRCHACM